MPELDSPGAPSARVREHKDLSSERSSRRKKDGGARPAIMPSQRVDHCTPPVVAEGVVYPVLGDPVDLDPCSNPQSIIRARRKVMLEEGEDPRGGGLAIPWKVRTVFVNPPYGKKTGLIEEWIKKIVVENRRHGCAVVALLPANVSAEWFDMVVATSRACFLWGPGIGGRRLQFIGNEHGATFHSALAYWGPDLPAFTRAALRYCHPWFPEYDLRLARSLLGDVRGLDGAVETMAAADELLALSRHDDLASALATLGSTSVGQILDAGHSALAERLRGLSAYELGTALLMASRSNPRAWLDHRIPRNPPMLDSRQLTLWMPAKASDEKDQLDPKASLDENVLSLVLQGTAIGEGVSSRELKQKLGCTTGQLRGSLSRLRDAEKITKQGRTQAARYVARSQATKPGEEGNTDHATRQQEETTG